MTLKESTGNAYQATVTTSGARAEVLTITIPTTIPLNADYTVWVSNGLPSSVLVATPVVLHSLAPVAQTLGIEPRVAARHTSLSTIKTVNDPSFSQRPAGDGVADDWQAIHQCLFELAVNGGGGLDGLGKTYRILANDLPAAAVHV